MDVTKVDYLLHNAVDIHVHTGPSIFPRLLDDYQLSIEAKNAGMKGLIIKAHEGSTVERAVNVTRQTGFKVEGCLVLNQFVGGFNPYAVELALKMGAKIIWMPTIAAQNHIDFYGGSGYKSLKSRHDVKELIKGYSIVDDHKKVLPEVIEILEIIAENGGALGTGHLSVSEVIVLVGLARDLGIEKILVAHPDLDVIGMPVDIQLDLAKKGGFIEKSMLTLMPGWQCVTAEYLAATIKKIGAEHCIMQTDFGQVNNPSPIEGMRMFIETMLSCGVNETEIKQMVSVNPEVFLA